MHFSSADDENPSSPVRKPSSGIEAERATSIHHAAKHNRSGSFEQDLCSDMEGVRNSRKFIKLILYDFCIIDFFKPAGTFARFRDLFTHVLSHHLVDVVSCSSYVAIRVVVVAIAEMR